jgi:hypothetical protein
MDDTDTARERLAHKLRVALALHEDGIALMRENLRRRHPGESDGEITARLRLWLRDRPADAPGRPVTWPRSRP